MCCANCFGDKGLKREIIPLRSTESGRCSYCNSENQELIEPNQLADYFELLISIYRPDDEGKTLVEWLKEDWSLFEHPRMDNAHAKELLVDILNDGEIVRKNFIPSELCHTDRLDRWEELRKELMHQNRFFPKTEIDADRFEELLSRLIFDQEEVPQVWHRARIQQADDSYEISDMGAPPKRIASHGRANPAGIPYLYLGSTHNTAISEIRPHPGEVACVAEFIVNQNLKIVDLREPRKLVSPFLLTDEHEIALLRGDIEFLEKLGKELTTPVLPTAAAIDYIPSQYLCEFIKRCDYRGVIYKSSVSEGINLALFNPSDAKPTTLQNYIISKVSVEIKKS